MSRSLSDAINANRDVDRLKLARLTLLQARDTLAKLETFQIEDVRAKEQVKYAIANCERAIRARGEKP